MREQYRRFGGVRMDEQHLALHNLIVVADTGPVISALQSKSMDLLGLMFGTLSVSTTCADELAQHGWIDVICRCYRDILQIETLTLAEHERAAEYAQRVAKQRSAGSGQPMHHLGEAEAMVLAERGLTGRTLVLLDERAARSVAQALGLNVSGFPGVLLAAARRGLIASEGMRQRLVACRDQGTHYSSALIERVFRAAQERVD